MNPRLKILCCIFLIFRFAYIYADHECSMYLIKVNCYTKSGRVEKVYMYANPYMGYSYTDSNLIYYPFSRMSFTPDNYCDNPITSPNQVDFSKVKGLDTTQVDKIIAIHKDLLLDKSLPIGKNTSLITHPKIITDSIHTLYYADTTHYNRYFIGISYVSQDEAVYNDENTHMIPNNKNQLVDSAKIYEPLICHYSKTKPIAMDSIYAITVDTIMWCDDYEQLQLVDDTDIQLFNSRKIIFYYRWEVNDCGDCAYWIDFISFDATWTKSRFVSLLNHDKLIKPFGTAGYNPISLLHPSIQRAIKSKKIYAFIRWSP